MRIATFAAIISIMAPALSHSADIDGQDGNARFPEAELVFKLDKTEQDNPKRSFNTISMGYIRSSGEYDKYLSASGYTAPEPLHNNIELSVGYLRLIRHIYFRESLEMNWGVGLGHANYQLTGSAAGKVAYFEDKAVGVHGQIGLAYHLTPMIALEGNLGIYVFPSDNDSTLLDQQIQFSITPVEAVRLHAGFRNWIHYIQFNNQNLDVQSRLTGLTGGITLYF